MTQAALRDTPAPSRNGLPSWLATALNVLSTLAVLPTLPVAMLRYLWTRPPIKLHLYLLSYVFRTRGQVSPHLTADISDAVAARIPKAFFPFPPGIRDKVRVEVVTIPPVRPGFRAADLLERPASVKPVTRPGFVLTPTKAKASGCQGAQEGEKLLFYCHGGAYVMGHPLWSPLPYKLARDTGCRVFAVQYRKSVDESRAFPAPFLDALAAWHYVTSTLGFEARDIILCGDSAGGHLALALTSLLSEAGDALPRGLVLSSPWVDFTVSFPSAQNNTIDYISHNAGAVAIDSLTRHYTLEARRSALISPVFAAPGAWKRLSQENVKVFIQVGTEETLFDEDHALAKTMQRDEVEVEVDEEIHGVHCGALTGLMGQAAYERLAEAAVQMVEGEL